MFVCLVGGTKALSVFVSHAIFSDRALVSATGDEYQKESKMAPGKKSLRVEGGMLCVF